MHIVAIWKPGLTQFFLQLSVNVTCMFNLVDRVKTQKYITCCAQVPKITRSTSIQTSAIYVKTISGIKTVAAVLFTFVSVSTTFTFWKTKQTNDLRKISKEQFKLFIIWGDIPVRKIFPEDFKINKDIKFRDLLVSYFFFSNSENTCLSAFY